MWPIGATGVDLSLYCEGIVTARGTSAVEYAGAGLRVIVGAGQLTLITGSLNLQIRNQNT